MSLFQILVLFDDEMNVFFRFYFSGWFGVLVTALVTSTKLSYTWSPLTTGIGDDLWRVYHPAISQPLWPTQPRCPSVGIHGCSGWFCLPLREETASSA